MNMLQLPAYNPGNALSFAPLNDAIDSNRQNALAQAAMGLKQRQLGLAENADARAGEMHGFQVAQARSQQEMTEARMAAGRVQGIMSLPPDQQPAAWAAARRMPGFSQLPQEFDDFGFASKAILARAQEYMDPLDRQAKQTQIGMHGAHADLYRAQAKAAGQKSELEGAISDMIRGNLAGGSAPPSGRPPAASAAPAAPIPRPQGGIQPQSFNGPSPQSGMLPIASGGQPQHGDPNLILAQAAGQPPAQPQQPPDLGPGQDMVDTPMGRMTRQRAQQLGFALALGGKGDAGKMMGDSAGQGMPGKEARNEIEKKLFAATEQRARLAGIQSKFKPEWQTIDEQLRQYGISWVDSIGPLRNRIPPEMRARHAEYAQYRQEAFQNINLYIKEITGAQMSEAEASRLRKAAPDPEKDSPTQFQAKMENLMAQTDLARARYNYILRKGFQGSPWEAGVAIESMQGIINDRGRQIEGMIRSSNPNAPAQAVQREAFRLVKQEFGI